MVARFGFDFGGIRRKREREELVPPRERPEFDSSAVHPNETPETREGAQTGSRPAWGVSSEESYPAPKPAPGGTQSAPKGGSAAQEAEAQETSADQAAQEAPQENDYDLDAGLEEFYTRLLNKLRSYGISSLPSFDALYALFEGFLRPSIDAAISSRERRGRQNMAELDADAYARGMGGSSYIFSMKSREQDDVASDIASLEGQYTASMSEYLYKAISSMQQLEADMAKTRMNIAAQKALAAARYSGSGSGGRSGVNGRNGKNGSDKTNGGYGHNKNGSYFDGVWYDGDFSYLKSNATYNDYAGYLAGLSASERYLFFTSNSRNWRMRRWQIQYNLPQIDYMDLYSEYMGAPGGVGGSEIHYGPIGGIPRWQATPY